MTDAVDDESSCVLLDVAGDGVATLTLNRPHRHNAWNPVLERRFYQLLDEAGRDDRVRAVVLTGAGRSFCPGVDSQRLDGIAGSAMDLTGRTSPAVTYAFRKPLVAALNGACAGLGLVQALMCDVRVLAAATAYARDLAANCSPASMALIKHQVLTDLDASCEQSMRRAYRAMAVLAQGPDFHEGIDSFIQKRPPEFPPLPADLNPADITGTTISALTIDPMNP